MRILLLLTLFTACNQGFMKVDRPARPEGESAVLASNNVTSVTAKVKSATSIELSWPADNPHNTYKIAYNTGVIAPVNCSVGTVIDHTSITGESHLVTGLATGYNYAFRVCSTDADGSNATSGTTEVKWLVLRDIGGMYMTYTYDNDYIYVVDGYLGGRVTVYDFSNKIISDDTYVSSFAIPVNFYSMSVHGNLLIAKTFFTDTDTEPDVYIYDITDKSNITLLSSLELTAAFNMVDDLTVDGNYLYIPLQSDVFIYDISDPSTPVLVATHTVASSIAYTVRISGNTMFIANSTNGIEVVDITTKTPVYTPSYITTFDPLIAGAPQFKSMEISGTRLYTTHNSFGTDNLVIIDITNPAAMSVLYTMNVTGAGDLDVVGNYVFVSNMDTGNGFGSETYVIDAPNLFAPSLLYTVPTESRLITAKDDVLIASGSNLRLEVYDISNMASAPVLIDSITPIMHWIKHVAAMDEYLVTVNSFFGTSNSLNVVDVSDLENPTIVYTDATFPGAGSMAMVENYLYFESGGILYVKDFTDPASPVDVTTIALTDTNDSTYMHSDGGNYLAIHHGVSADITVIDITVRASPSEVGVYPGSYLYSSGDTAIDNNPVQVNGNYVIAATTANDIEIINAATLANVSTINIPVAIYSYMVNGNYLYAMTDDGGGSSMLLTYNITNPAAPSGIIYGNAFTYTMTGLSLAKNDDTMIIQNRYGIRLNFDLTDPSQPQGDITLEKRGYSYIFVQNSYANINSNIMYYNNFGSLEVMDLTDYYNPVYGVLSK